ncbi:hypothetical protein [Geobacter sp. AOG1]|uniref:hypothetical protein n=1 Tax=Geobacter sp. AOG1 TaxID=1566346 RepID=UPI001CC6FDA1|nr:hypothetical protein [Geobacter sp. AOG1]GFE57736.1 hypothetical protein AOG1_16160 [Geobacter sp. AOG1]
MSKEVFATMPIVQTFPELSNTTKAKPLMRLLHLRAMLPPKYFNLPLAELPQKERDYMKEVLGRGLKPEYLDIPGEELMKLGKGHNII